VDDFSIESEHLHGFIIAMEVNFNNCSLGSATLELGKAIQHRYPMHKKNQVLALKVLDFFLDLENLENIPWLVVNLPPEKYESQLG